jgi:hypothetical protein
MNKTYTLKARSVIRRLVLLPALVVGLSLAFTGAASAQTVASIDNVSTNGNGHPGPQCPNNFYCGYANIPGYGAAFWSFNSPAGATPTSPNCASYVGTSTFTLIDHPASQLVLNEYTVFCTPGNSVNAPNYWKVTNGHPWAYGHPGRVTGTWTVCTATAAPDPTTGCGESPAPGAPPLVSSVQFGTLTGGSGTDWLQTNGARFTVGWDGTLTAP